MHWSRQKCLEVMIISTAMICTILVGAHCIDIGDHLSKYFQAAWGGGLLMSNSLRVGRFDGVERADSLTWNPHKLMGVLLQCSTLHLKEKVEMFANSIDNN